MVIVVVGWVCGVEKLLLDELQFELRLEQSESELNCDFAVVYSQLRVSWR